MTFLVLGTDEGSALARLDVLELNDLKDLAVLLEGDTVTEFACRNHIEIPPILDYTYLYLFYRKSQHFQALFGLFAWKFAKFCMFYRKT